MNFAQGLHELNALMCLLSDDGESGGIYYYKLTQTTEIHSGDNIITVQQEGRVSSIAFRSRFTLQAQEGNLLDGGYRQLIKSLLVYDQYLDTLRSGALQSTLPYLEDDLVVYWRSFDDFYHQNIGSYFNYNPGDRPWEHMSGWVVEGVVPRFYYFPDSISRGYTHLNSLPRGTRVLTSRFTTGVLDSGILDFGHAQIKSSTFGSYRLMSGELIRSSDILLILDSPSNVGKRKVVI